MEGSSKVAGRKRHRLDLNVDLKAAMVSDQFWNWKQTASRQIDDGREKNKRNNRCP